MFRQQQKKTPQNLSKELLAFKKREHNFTIKTKKQKTLHNNLYDEEIFRVPEMATFTQDQNEELLQYEMGMLLVIFFFFFFLMLLVIHIMIRATFKTYNSHNTLESFPRSRLMAVTAHRGHNHVQDSGQSPSIMITATFKINNINS